MYLYVKRRITLDIYIIPKIIVAPETIPDSFMILYQHTQVQNEEGDYFQLENLTEQEKKERLRGTRVYKDTYICSEKKSLALLNSFTLHLL